MCHPPGARPPSIPSNLHSQTGGTSGEDVVLTSEDGSQFRAYVAPSTAGTNGVVIAPDTRGLHPFYEELAERFASARIHAIAFDYYGRSAGIMRRSPDFEFSPHNSMNTGDQIHADLRAATVHLRGATPVTRIYVVGFCKGGRLAFNAAAEHAGLAGVVGFYGTPAARRSEDHLGAPLERVRLMRVPVLGLFGGADAGIPEATVRAFEAALSEHRVRHYLHIYPGAPHSFFDREFTAHASACDDAWRRVLGFIHTGDPAARA
jgi:carboxymethylenebutenolidase